MTSHPLPLVLIAAVTLSACGLDALEGKDTSRRAYEHRQSLIMQPAVATSPAPTQDVELAPIVEAAAEPAPAAEAVSIPPAPVAPCVEVFRVTRCVDGQAVDWTM